MALGPLSASPLLRSRQASGRSGAGHRHASSVPLGAHLGRV